MYFFLFRRNVNWQIYSVWHWPWWTKRFDPEFQVWSHYAGVGPFQFRWYGNKWW